MGASASATTAAHPSASPANVCLKALAALKDSSTASGSDSSISPSISLRATSREAAMTSGSPDSRAISSTERTFSSVEGPSAAEAFLATSARAASSLTESPCTYLHPRFAAALALERRSSESSTVR